MTSGIALFGAGRIGRIHAANVAAQPSLHLRHVVDVAPTAAQELAHRYGATAGTIEVALGDPEVAGVIVASSTDTHLDLTLRAAAAGKAVFCEKPVDMNLARARAATARLDPKRVFVGFNRRFDPSFASLKANIASGTFGRLETLQISSNDPGPPPLAYLKSSGGLFKDMTIHDFDMARFLLDEPPSEIFAWGSCLVDPEIATVGDVDTARILIRTGSGRLCTIANSRRSAFGYDQRIEAFCAHAMIAADNHTETSVRILQESGPAGPPLQNFFLERYAAAFWAEMAHFAEIVTNSATPLVTFEDGVEALALAEAAAQSMREGRPVRM